MSIYLALGMSGIILTHVLSTEMTIVVLTIILLLNLKDLIIKKKKEVVIILGLAFLETMCITASFWVAFIDAYISNSLRINETVKGSMEIQHFGISISECFMFFRNIFGDSSKNISMNLSIGIVCFVVLVLGIYIALIKRNDSSIFTFLFSSLVLLFICTNLFPWDIIEQKLPFFGRLFVSIQFPWRYMVFFILSVAILSGFVCVYYSNTNMMVYNILVYLMVILSILSVIWFFCLYNDFDYPGYKRVTNYDANALNYSYYSGASGADEFVPTKVNTGLLEGGIVSKDVEALSVIKRSGCRWEIDCQSEKGGQILFPVFYYKGYKAKDYNGKLLGINDGYNGLIEVQVTPGYAGKLILDYDDVWYWRFAEIVSLISALVLIRYFVKEKISNCL